MELRLQSEGGLDWLVLFVDNERRQYDFGQLDCMKLTCFEGNAMAPNRNAPLVNISILIAHTEGQRKVASSRA